MSNVVPIVDYIKQENNELYNEEFNQTIRFLLSDLGWRLPKLSNATVAAFTADIPEGSQWYNTDLAKMQIKTPGGVETITSM